MASSRISTVFLYGILRRSGTNHLNQLLLKHPSCVQPAIHVRENWFLDRSDPLMGYVEDLFRLWSNPKWKGEPCTKEGFLAALGAGQINFLRTGLAEAANKVLVTKTPSVAHLKRHQQFFPGAKCVVLVRDPLDVAASTFNTWRTPVSRTLDAWNQGCRHIHAMGLQAEHGAYLLRYEDLVSNPAEEVNKCLSYMGLDPDLYPWDTIEDLPVLGSSDSGAAFNTVDRSDSFKAIGKWTSLPVEQKQLIEKHFDDRCAAYFGYASATTSSRQPAPLPDLQRRSIIGAGFQGQTSDSEVAVQPPWRKRIELMKEGLRLILRSLR